MSVDAVLVSFTLDGHFKTYETSGILFNPNLVLLTGTAFIPLVQQEKWISLFVNSCSSKLEPNKLIQEIHFRVFAEKKTADEASPRLACFEASPLGAWKCPLVSQSTRTLLSDWTLGHLSTEADKALPPGDDVHLSKELMSVFVVLKCGGGRGSEPGGEETYRGDIRVLADSLPSLGNARRGQEVEVVSTPFGHTHFVNSLSRGVISNAVGRDRCIILSDARTVSGCEGGPIFLSETSRKDEEKGKLLGIVTCPLTWWGGEWVGLTMGVSLLPVLKKLLRADTSVGTTPDSLSSVADSSPFKLVDESVVLVRSMASWGSGVVLQGTSGIVVTCSHVVKDDERVSVFHMGNKWTGDVVFRSKNDVAFDLAVIKIERARGFPRGIRFSRKPAKLGEKVMAAGFPFFSEQDDVSLQPSVVSGCVSSVNPHMIQTTCCIQSGFSGGPLLRDGELLGIIISNTLCSGALFPHINFVAPTTAFIEPILKYAGTNDVRHLQDLESSNPEVQLIWKLHNSKL